MEISNLLIEVTRRCNMSCEHCLRGNAEKQNIDLKYIDSLLLQVDGYISNVTFSGGEPSLYLEAIEYFLIKAKEYNISIGSFYIATNGLKISEKFVMLCLKLYAYCDEKHMCQVEVSNDYYHQVEGSYNTELLSGLSFFKRKYESEGYYYSGENAVNQGNYAENYGNGSEEIVSTIYTEEDFRDSSIYLNAIGNIINGCDWSYENQKNHVLCHVDNLKEYFEGLD